MMPEGVHFLEVLSLKASPQTTMGITFSYG